mgnify:CR=1 FL=1
MVRQRFEKRLFVFFLFIPLLVVLVSSKRIEMLKILVVFPTVVPPLNIFLDFPLSFHCRCSSGDKMMATPPFFPFAGWVSGPWWMK